MFLNAFPHKVVMSSCAKVYAIFGKHAIRENLKNNGFSQLIRNIYAFFGKKPLIITLKGQHFSIPS